MIVATVRCGGPGLAIPSGLVDAEIDNRDNHLTPCEAYQKILENNPGEDVIVYCHDDVTVHDPQWLFRMQVIFATRPKCVAVGLGGAMALSSPDLYRKPFNIWNMARRGYASNQTDAEVHGERFDGDKVQHN